MKKIILITLGFALALPLHAGQGKGGTTGNNKPRRNPAAVFHRKDKDRDGMLTKEEFTARAKDPAKAGNVFARRDRNSDGKLTLAEFKGKGKKRAGKRQ